MFVLKQQRILFNILRQISISRTSREKCRELFHSLSVLLPHSVASRRRIFLENPYRFPPAAGHRKPECPRVNGPVRRAPVCPRSAIRDPRWRTTAKADRCRAPRRSSAPRNYNIRQLFT